MEKRIEVVEAHQRTQARAFAALRTTVQQLSSDFANLRCENPQGRPMENRGLERKIDPAVLVIATRALVAKDKAQAAFAPSSNRVFSPWTRTTCGRGARRANIHYHIQRCRGPCTAQSIAVHRTIQADRRPLGTVLSHGGRCRARRHLQQFGLEPVRDQAGHGPQIGEKGPGATASEHQILLGRGQERHLCQLAALNQDLPSRGGFQAARRVERRQPRGAADGQGPPGPPGRGRPLGRGGSARR
eukprot:438750-Pyramimonas_sp.AAC.1